MELFNNVTQMTDTLPFFLKFPDEGNFFYSFPNIQKIQVVSKLEKTSKTAFVLYINYV